MLSCKDTVEQGSDYLERELGFWRRVEMKLHLMLCVHCRRYMKQLRQTIAMLRRRKGKQPSQEQLESLKQSYQKQTNS